MSSIGGDSYTSPSSSRSIPFNTPSVRSRGRKPWSTSMESNAGGVYM